MSAQGAPVRNRQNIPFRTRRSSTRGTPRTLFGSSGAITDHSKSVRSKRAIQTSIVGHLNHCSPKNGIHFMGTSPSAQAKLHRRQGPTRRDQQARRQLFASHISQWRSRSVVLVEDSKSRPLVGVAAWPKAPARRSRCAGEQNGAHCLGHHEPRGGLPNRRSGGLISQATAPQAGESRKRVMAKSVVPTN